jgi:hypothetical protein
MATPTLSFVAIAAASTGARSPHGRHIKCTITAPAASKHLLRCLTEAQNLLDVRIVIDHSCLLDSDRIPSRAFAHLGSNYWNINVN